MSFSTSQSMGNFSHKKALHGGTNFFGEIFLGGLFYVGTHDQIMQGGKLMLNRFQRPSQVSFSFHWPWPGLLIYYLKINTTNRGMNLINTFCRLFLWGWGYHVNSFFFFFFLNIVVTILWCLDYRPLLDLCIYRPDSWVKVLRSESEGSWLRPRLPVTLRSNKYLTQWLRWG